jgi:hypothetical protein
MTSESLQSFRRRLLARTMNRIDYGTWESLTPVPSEPARILSYELYETFARLEAAATRTLDPIAIWSFRAFLEGRR